MFVSATARRRAAIAPSGAAILTSMRLSVSVQEDHLASLVRSPLDGLTELIWNSLDADADNVTIVFERNELGGIEAIRVEDDGHGMTPGDIAAAFDRLGGSWKLLADRSRTKGRSLHGKRGQGRWRALGLGGTRVRWDTVAEDEGRRVRSQIEIKRESLRDADVTGPEETDLPVGTATRVDGITEAPSGLLTLDLAERLSVRFALHLLKYPSVAVRVDNHRLDPSSLVDRVTDIPLSDGVELTIIEWKPQFKVKDHTLYLCDEAGVALHEMPAGVPVPGVGYSAYVKSRLVRDLEDRLLLAGLEPQGLAPLISDARGALRAYFDERLAERSRDVIRNWKEEQVYPFVEPAHDEVESVKRQMFDVVAFAASPAVDASRDPRSKRLSLRLIEQALESEPARLRHILEEVLRLPPAQVRQLEELLQRTTLTSIVTAARKIADRLDFIAGLEFILFNPDAKAVMKERSQLHKIVRNEPWLFGEEYALAVDDRSLNEVLAQHRHLLGDEVSADEAPVLDSEGRIRIIDLMFAGSMKQARDRREHLVVELKRPSVKIGADEITQIQEYAFAVANDARFDIAGVEWDFWVVSDELTDYAKEMGNKSGLRPGEIHRSQKGNVRVWAVPWARLIEDASHRLKFVQEQLNYIATTDAAMGYLQRAHNQFLPEDLRASSREDDGEDGGPDGDAPSGA